MHSVHFILCWFEQAEIIIAMTHIIRMTECCYTTQFHGGFFFVWRTANGSAFSIKYFAVLTRAGGEALAL